MWPTCDLMEAMVKWVQLRSLKLDSYVMFLTHLNDNPFYQQFEKILPKMTALTELSMTGMSQHGDLPALLAALPPQLEILDLSENELSINPPFCEVLSRMTALRKLNLSGCRCFLNNRHLLSPTCPALTSLHMNDLHASSATVIAFVKRLTQLQLFHLESCFEDHDVAKVVRSLYHHTHLTSLSLADNILAGESGQALANWPQLLCLEEVGLNKPYKRQCDTSVVEEALQRSLCFRRIVQPALMNGEITLQQATREACQRNAARHTTLLSICSEPEAMGSILVCKIQA